MMRMNVSEYVEVGAYSFLRDVSRWRQLQPQFCMQLICVDEIMALSSHLVEYILDMNKARRKYNPRACTVFFGDHEQLLPVKGEPFWKSSRFLSDECEIYLLDEIKVCRRRKYFYSIFCVNIHLVDMRQQVEHFPVFIWLI
jgi:hypothetical protein